jgi:hypothetical protein
VVVTEFGVNAVPDLSDDGVFEVLLEMVVSPHARQLWRCDACDRVFVETEPEEFKYDRWRPDREP